MRLFPHLSSLLLIAITMIGAENVTKPAPGTLLVSEDFSQPIPTLSQGRAYTTKHSWRLLSGKWEFVDGAVRGSQLAADGRAGFIVYYQRFTSAVIQFDVKLEGCRQVIFRIQDAIPEHICSVRLTKDGFTAQKDDHDHTGPDLAVPFGKSAVALGTNAWKTVRVEIDGEKMATTIDGQTVRGTHPLLASEKSTIEFVVAGESASFRNVRLWTPASRSYSDRH